MLDYEKAIKNRMDEKKLTYEDVEEISGYSARAIRDVANGRIKQPYFFMVETILESLGLRLAIIEADE